jgi:hypothetical protein
MGDSDPRPAGRATTEVEVMRRTMLIGLLLAAAALAIPGTASARRAAAARHHSAHHACKRKHHCAHARLLRFGPVSEQGATANAPSAPAPTTPAPTTPAPTSPSTEIAGTVASFTGGVLTINLTGGGSVSGKVTEATELECETPGGDDQGGEGDDDSGGPTGDAFRADQIAGGDQEQSGEDDQGGGDDMGQSSCPPEALKEGAMVREAELEVGPGGAVWEQIVLVG